MNTNLISKTEENKIERINTLINDATKNEKICEFIEEFILSCSIIINEVLYEDFDKINEIDIKWTCLVEFSS